MGMFKYSEFDLERTTTKSTIIVYISLDFLLWQTLPFAARNQANTTSDKFCFDSWKFPITINKTCHRVVKKRNGGGNNKMRVNQAGGSTRLRRVTRARKIA